MIMYDNRTSSPFEPAKGPAKGPVKGPVKVRSKEESLLSDASRTQENNDNAEPDNAEPVAISDVMSPVFETAFSYWRCVVVLEVCGCTGGVCGCTISIVAISISIRRHDPLRRT